MPFKLEYLLISVLSDAVRSQQQLNLKFTRGLRRCRRPARTCGLMKRRLARRLRQRASLRWRAACALRCPAPRRGLRASGCLLMWAPPWSQGRARTWRAADCGTPGPWRAARNCC